jgi:hypothetical protein
MVCIHRLASNVIDYVISNIIIYNQIVNFDLLKYHDPDYDHRPLTLTINFVMQKSSIEETYDSQKHLIFDKDKVDNFLKDLNNGLNLLSNNNNIDDLYHNFTTTLSTSINKFSIEVLCKKEKRTTNPWYDKECKIARKFICF